MEMSRRGHAEWRRRVREAIDARDAAAMPDDVAAHVRDCSDCASLLARTRATVRRLRSIPQPLAPSSLADRIFAASQSLPAPRTRMARRPWLRLAAVGFPVATAAAVALFVALREDTPRPVEIRIVEVPLDVMQKNSPFSPALLGKAIRKTQG